MSRADLIRCGQFHLWQARIVRQDGLRFRPSRYRYWHHVQRAAECRAAALESGKFDLFGGAL